MNVITRKEIERVIEFLKKSAGEENQFLIRYAIANMVAVLEQALDNYEEDAHHPHLYFEISKAMTIYDAAIRDCCTTDCANMRAGTCPYIGVEGKCSCQRIFSYLVDEN